MSEVLYMTRPWSFWNEWVSRFTVKKPLHIVEEEEFIDAIKSEDDDDEDDHEYEYEWELDEDAYAPDGFNSEFWSACIQFWKFDHHYVHCTVAVNKLEFIQALRDRVQYTLLDDKCSINLLQELEHVKISLKSALEMMSRHMRDQAFETMPD